jgi:hypothetical protein
MNTKKARVSGCLSVLETSMNSVQMEQKSYEMPPRGGFQKGEQQWQQKEKS